MHQRCTICWILVWSLNNRSLSSQPSVPPATHHRQICIVPVKHIAFILRSMLFFKHQACGINPAVVLGSGPHQLFPLSEFTYWLTRTQMFTIIRNCYIQGPSKVQKLPKNDFRRALPRTSLRELTAPRWCGGCPPSRTPPRRASGCGSSGLAPQLDPTNILNRLTPAHQAIEFAQGNAVT